MPVKINQTLRTVDSDDPRKLKDHMNYMVRQLSDVFRAIERGSSGTSTVQLSGSSPESGVISQTAPSNTSIRYRCGSEISSGGDTTVTFSSPIGSSDYVVIILAYDSQGTVGYDSVVKTTNGFTLKNLGMACTIDYIAIPYK